MSQIIGMTSPGGQIENDHKEVNALQMPYPEELYRKRKHNTLPSNVAIPVGLAQVFIGGSMVVCGSLALRYRSYLFYYGTGLWAGTISGITGALLVMATKEGLPKPRWLCGGKKWQIHVVIASTMLALTASVLMSIFSTSGLMQDTMHSVGVDLGTPTKDEETFEKRKSTGVVINAILLLLAMLEILLSFCSLGIGLRILCHTKSGGSLFSADSGSEVTINDILGSGPEYEARKDRLLRWLGHQRRNFFMTPQSPATITQAQIKPSLQMTPPNHSPSTISGRKRLGSHLVASHLVALKPPQMLIPHHPTNGHPPPRPVFYAHHTASRPYAYPVMVPVPLCPAPVRRSMTPIGEGAETKRRRKEHRSGSGSHGSLSSGSKSSKRSHRSTNQRRRAQNESKVHEITEEEIGKTYTGLDRVVAEDFISNSMDKY